MTRKLSNWTERSLKVASSGYSIWCLKHKAHYLYSSTVPCMIWTNFNFPFSSEVHQVMQSSPWSSPVVRYNPSLIPRPLPPKGLGTRLIQPLAIQCTSTDWPLLFIHTRYTVNKGSFHSILCSGCYHRNKNIIFYPLLRLLPYEKLYAQVTMPSNNNLSPTICLYLFPPPFIRW